VALLPAAALALDPVVLDDGRGEYRLGTHLELLEDPARRLTIAEVASPAPPASFVPSRSAVPNLGLTRSAYWARIRLRDRSGTSRRWLLEFGWPITDRVTLYVPEPGGGFVEKRAGDLVPFVAWEVPYRNPTFRLPQIGPGWEGTLYLRLEGEDTMLVPATVWAADAFAAKRRAESFTYGFYYGVLAILAVYNLVLFASLRDASHLYYVLLIGAWTLYHASLSGFATQYLWPRSAAVARWSIHVAATLAFVCSALFTRSFLVTRAHAPALDRCLVGLAAIGCALLCWPWLGSVHAFIVYASGLGLVGAVLLLVAGFRCWRAGYRPARYFLATWTVAIAALFVWALRGYGLVPSNVFTDRAFELVVLSTAVTLSLGLADRVNVLRSDLVASVQDKERLLHAVQDLNRDLERRIDERTRDLAEKTRQLEIANRHKSEFLANMSHELRTPLNAVIGFSEVLLARMFGELNAKQAEYVDDIRDSGRHLLSLINDILDLSKIEAGRMELEPSRVDLPAAIENALMLVRERAHRHGIALSARLDEGLGEVVADERKLKQVLVNLLANAVKFTPEGGRVEIAAARHDGTLEIAVSDTGVGIAPEDQATIFEEFRQVGADRTRRVEGTGLGLSLVKRLVELHGGTVRLQSELGKGSTFTVRLPVSPWPGS
jgi:signal transduction histidine kinase